MYFGVPYDIGQKKILMM